MNNPLLKIFDSPYEATPFSKIQNEHFIPALEKSIVLALEEIAEITQQTETPNFENTLGALDACGKLVGRNSSILFNLNNAETSEELQGITQQAAPLLTQFQNDIRLNTTLFERIKTVYENEDREKLSPEQNTLLEKEYKSFVRNGALLSVEAKEELRTIDTELAQLSLRFGENVLADTQAFQLLLDKESDLDGLPESIREMAATLAKAQGKKGWLFTLDYPSYVPFMTYAENRALRKKMSMAFGRRGYQENDHNNVPIIKKIVRLRKERAALLGYPSHAAFVLEERMAESEENVKAFLDRLYEQALPAAKREWDEMETFAREQLQLKTLQKWDTAFVSEKLKQAQLDLEEEALKPYFPLEKVKAGLFTITEKLFGLRFEKNIDLEGYHKEVDVYEVFDKKGTFCALLYTDFFPRPGKRNGAWMTAFRSQNKSQRPHISIVCNFTQPTETTPALLTFQEVTTLFHEFGHALHGMLANTIYNSLSGTSVFWDFVELPSQIMENWCYQPEALALFAKHYQNDTIIPQALIEKIKKTAHFQQGLQTLRQLGFGFLDLSYHGANAHSVTDIKKHENTWLQKVQFTPEVVENATSTAFSHIFHGGYSAGYYSYKWAEVLDADAFELFLEKGIFDPETAAAFAKHILSKGGTEHPMTLYKRFRGQVPDPAALLRRAGLVES